MIRRLIFVACLCSLTVPLLAVDPHRAIASRVTTAKTPIWVPANEAVTAMGEVDAARTHEQPVWRQVREGQIPPTPVESPAEAAQPCVGVTVFTGGGPAPRIVPTIESLSRQSSTVAVGTVAELVPGFYDGVPATIVRVSVSDRIRRAGNSALFIYPVARFTGGGRTFCRTNLLYGDTPSVGDKVLLFGNVTMDADGQVFVPAPYEVLIERHGRLAIPAALSNDADINSATTLSDLAHRVQLWSD